MMTRASILLALLTLLAACATTPADRIARHRAEFAAWPAEVQAKVRTGRVAVGFTPAQVRMALGKPDVQRIRATPAGTRELWIYGGRRPRVVFGIGVAGGGRSGMVGGSTLVRAGGPGAGGSMRVTFLNGRVTLVEQTGR